MKWLPGDTIPASNTAARRESETAIGAAAIFKMGFLNTSTLHNNGARLRYHERSLWDSSRIRNLTYIGVGLDHSNAYCLHSSRLNVNFGKNKP